MGRRQTSIFFTASLGHLHRGQFQRLDPVIRSSVRNSARQSSTEQDRDDAGTGRDKYLRDAINFVSFNLSALVRVRV